MCICLNLFRLDKLHVVCNWAGLVQMRIVGVGIDEGNLWWKLGGQ